MNKDFAASVIRATQDNGNLGGLVHDALAKAVSKASDPDARRAVLNEIEKSIDETMFPPGSLHLVEAMMRELHAFRSGTESSADTANAGEATAAS